MPSRFILNSSVITKYNNAIQLATTTTVNITETIVGKVSFPTGFSRLEWRLENFHYRRALRETRSEFQLATEPYLQDFSELVNFMNSRVRKEQERSETRYCINRMPLLRESRLFSIRRGFCLNFRCGLSAVNF